MFIYFCLVFRVLRSRFCAIFHSPMGETELYLMLDKKKKKWLIALIVSYLFNYISMHNILKFLKYAINFLPIRGWLHYSWWRRCNVWSRHTGRATEDLDFPCEWRNRSDAEAGRTMSIPWLLMPWLLQSPDHQQPQYRLGKYMDSVLSNGFNSLRPRTAYTCML